VHRTSNRRTAGVILLATSIGVLLAGIGFVYYQIMFAVDHVSRFLSGSVTTEEIMYMFTQLRNLASSARLTTRIAIALSVVIAAVGAIMLRLGKRPRGQPSS
jgi:hypothetical protein